MSDNLSETSIKEQFKSNTKLKYTTYVVGGLAVLSIAYFSYKQFIFTPSNEKSKEAYFEGLNYADKDSVDVAIETLSPVVKKYDGKVGGEVAQFTLARQFMAKGEFKKALENLEGVHLEDTYLSICLLDFREIVSQKWSNTKKLLVYTSWQQTKMIIHLQLQLICLKLLFVQKK